MKMNTKLVIKIVLLVFVFGSVAYLIADEFISKSPADLSRETDASTVNIPSEANLPAKEPAAEKVIVYYFHGTMRCMTCKKFEAFTNEALENNFSDAIASGILELRVVNIDEPENKHFVDDYQLYTRSIVVVRIQNGRELEWKNLDKIWDLVKDKALFMDYVTGKINSFMETE